MSLQNKDTFTLSGTDISNGYVDCSQLTIADSMNLLIEGAGPAIETVDYTLSTVGGVTRITFSAGVLALLASGQVVQAQYEY